MVASAGWGTSEILGLRIFGWQWILLIMGLPSLVAAALFLTLKEPVRLAPADAPQPPVNVGLGRKIITFMGFDAAKAIHANGKVFYPMFGALALSAVEVFGLQFWRVPFMVRTYGWDEGQIGAALSIIILIASLAGLAAGGAFVEYLARRHKDANVRAAFFCFMGTTVSTIFAILIPSAWGSMVAFGFAGFFGIAGAVRKTPPSNASPPTRCAGKSPRFTYSCSPFSARWAALSSAWCRNIWSRNCGRRCSSPLARYYPSPHT